MRKSLLIRSLVVGLAAGVLAGCSGASNSQSSAVLPSHQLSPAKSSARPALGPFARIVALPELIANAARFGPPPNRALPPVGGSPVHLLVVCAVSANVCNRYSRPGYHPVNTISGLSAPQGVATGVGAKTYVANSGAGNVEIYTRTGTSPIGMLADTGSAPVDVALAQDEVVVSNFTAGSSNGNVAVYRGGATSPSYTLSDPTAVNGVGVAIDADGNCFWSNNTATGAQITEFRGCRKTARPIHLKPAVSFAGGLAFDGGGNLWYTDQEAGLFRCVGLGSCTLVVASSLSCTPGVSVCDPVMINFDRTFSTLFLADAGYGIYTVRSFADGVSPDYVITPILGVSGMPIGVAPEPAPTLPPH